MSAILRGCLLTAFQSADRNEDNTASSRLGFAKHSDITLQSQNGWAEPFLAIPLYRVSLVMKSSI